MTHSRHDELARVPWLLNHTLGSLAAPTQEEVIRIREHFGWPSSPERKRRPSDKAAMANSNSEPHDDVCPGALRDLQSLKAPAAAHM